MLELLLFAAHNNPLMYNEGMKGGKRKKLSWQKHLLILLGGAFATIFVISVVVLTSFYLRHRNDPYNIGVSFADQYTKELGLDPHETLNALIDDLGIRRFRLMSYWDEIEKTPGQYDFSELDYEMGQVAKSGGKVTLAIGMRQPRYPECHYPDWVSNLNSDQQGAATVKFVDAVVAHVKDRPELDSYQLENEALNTAFGLCHDFSRKRLTDELNDVKQIDSNHPVIISVSNEFGLPLGRPHPDIVGFSIYHRVFDQTVTHRYVEYPIPAWYHGWRAAIIQAFEGKSTIIHELQAEPWGPQATKNLSIEEQSKSMDPARLQGRVDYAKATGIHTFDLWGGEWWYWRKVKFNDPSLWNVAKQIYAQK